MTILQFVLWSLLKVAVVTGVLLTAVADSVPELEYQESIHKAQTVIRAVERAREM